MACSPTTNRLGRSFAVGGLLLTVSAGLGGASAAADTSVPAPGAPTSVDAHGPAAVAPVREQGDPTAPTVAPEVDPGAWDDCPGCGMG
jgi:hypothetical protein